MDTTQFWEARARRFAGRGAGLQAVCSYAMPGFYNWAIDVTQRAALKDSMDSVGPNLEVMDYGCGIGRWSREAARRGAKVTAIDFSASMIEEARRRTESVSLPGSCRFVQSDVCSIDLTERFDLILGVTVLQHLLDDARLTQAIARLANHLRPGGRLVMVEAAPSRADHRGNTVTFRARPLATYLAGIEAAGLEVIAVRGVDPIPFKLWVIPQFKRLPRPVAVGVLALATLLSLPLDLLLARLATRHSWHKVIVAQARGGRP